MFEEGIDRTTPIYIGLGGILLTILLTVVGWSLGTGRTRALALAQDITADLAAAKLSAENALRETEALRKTLDEHAIFSVADARGRIIDINDAFCKISGYTREELLGKDHKLLNSGTHPKAFWVDVWKTIANGNAWHGEVCNRSKDGSLYWVDSIIAPFHGADGKIERYVSIRSDITAKKQAEDAARAATEMLRRTGAMAAIGGWELEVATGRITWSPEVYSIHGVEPGTPMTLDSVLALYPPDEGARKGKVISDAILDHKSWDNEFSRFDPAGNKLWIRSRGEPVVENGVVVKLVATVQDISVARFNAEMLTTQLERLQEAEQLANLGHWQWDIASDRIDWSDQIFRIHRRDPALGTPNYNGMLALYDPAGAAELHTAAGKALESGQPYSLTLRTSDVEERYLLGQGQPRRDADGRIVGLYGTVRDITEQVLSEHRLSEAMKHAEAATRAKSEFLANMSHEIRTPLTAILGYADLLHEDGDVSHAPQRRLDSIDTIRNAGQHLLTVINDILDLSKIEADKMTVETIDTPIVQLLREVKSLMRPRAHAKGIILNAVLATPVPDRIMGDPTRLRQILMNLIGNAVKFTECGSVRLTASVQQGPDAAKLVLQVQDTGPGMTPEQAARLFAAFSQADITVTRQHGGTGLGLTISRRLARLMGGEVSIAWTLPGKGSCFQLEIPLVAVAGSALVSDFDSVQSHQPIEANAVSTTLQGSILLAEDGPDNQRLISFHLRKAGAEVSIADNGRIALGMIETAAASGKPFDLLLTDMQMPEMDGYTLARTLRQHGSTMPIVALTAHAMAEDRKKCTDAGCDDYASKPIDKLALLRTCAQWMNNARTERCR